MSAQLIECRGHKPKIGKNVYLAPNAILIGDVTIGDNCSIWFNCVLRGDVMPITVGNETNIQDGTIIHGSFGSAQTEIADRVTIGHGVILHGCKIHRESLVGMGSVLLDNCVVSENSFVGAGSLIKENFIVPSKHLVLGRPGKVVRPLTDEEIKNLSVSADNYLHYKTWY